VYPWCLIQRFYFVVNFCIKCWYESFNINRGYDEDVKHSFKRSKLYLFSLFIMKYLKTIKYHLKESAFLKSIRSSFWSNKKAHDGYYKSASVGSILLTTKYLYEKWNFGWGLDIGQWTSCEKYISILILWYPLPNSLDIK
jgi:hypothetical protein